MNGTVKFFNESKGFGFITNDDTKKDVFVHITGIAKGETLSEGDKVSYDEGEGRNGVIATNVKVIG
ncbi:MAG TPA: cold-shock protein [Flavobacteriaceae bacterium]|jgi:CspA family cold shock protein|nr:cold-shock protein [Flavobacteriaceae bacterium]MDH3381248.1 cold-shock protein [Flavobacteriaceae bacterium]HEX5742536.1 cold-shock protein [Flavobacteriaceae bacterium]